jgi:hypothetical protein
MCLISDRTFQLGGGILSRSYKGLTIRGFKQGGVNKPKAKMADWGRHLRLLHFFAAAMLAVCAAVDDFIAASELATAFFASTTAAG